MTGLLQSGAHYVYTLSGVAAFAPGDSIELYGTKGVLHYDVLNQRIAIGRVDPARRVRPGRVTERPVVEPVEIPPDLLGTWTVEADFAAAIRDGAPVYPSFEDGVAYMEFVEAVGRSLAQDRTVQLPIT